MTSALKVHVIMALQEVVEYYLASLLEDANINCYPCKAHHNNGQKTSKWHAVSMFSFLVLLLLFHVTSTWGGGSSKVSGCLYTGYNRVGTVRYF